jgi:hypothetical protein
LPLTICRRVEKERAMSDGIDLATVQIHNSHDVKNWPATATITRLEFRPTGVHVEHTRNHGSASWPNFRPAGWDGDLQYTLWIFLQIAGSWHGSGCIQFWQSCDQNGGPPEEFAKNWYYAADRWAPMTGHQPAPGELVGFMVSAGDARNSGAQSLQERSNVVALPFPTSGAVYTASTDVVPTPPIPEPIPSPVQPPAGPAEGLDELRRAIADLTRKVETLLARSAPVYRGTLPAVPALGVPAGTVVLKPES